MDGQQLAVAVGVVVNHAPRPPALRPIAYIKYPAREIRPVLIQDGSWRVSLARWGMNISTVGLVLKIPFLSTEKKSNILLIYCSRMGFPSVPWRFIGKI